MIFQMKKMESDYYFIQVLYQFFFNRLSMNKKNLLSFFSPFFNRLLNDDVINFMLTTLRNCLIGLNIESAEEIQIHNGCIIFISLLIHRHSNKQMNFLSDCLLRLAMFNTNAQVNIDTKRQNIPLLNSFRCIYKQVNYFYKN